jgi:hypothetical protein
MENTILLAETANKSLHYDSCKKMKAEEKDNNESRLLLRA